MIFSDISFKDYFLPEKELGPQTSRTKMHVVTQTIQGKIHNLTLLGHNVVRLKINQENITMTYDFEDLQKHSELKGSKLE